MLLIGALTALGLTLIGVPLGITLGLVAGLLNFVPYVGPLLSFVPAGLMALLQGPGVVLWSSSCTCWCRSSRATW
jgi:predicted PurR-regulated permease PerM